MKKVVLMIMIALFSNVTDLAAINNEVVQQEHVEKRRKKKCKSRVSGQHSWKNVSTGRTCNKKRRH